MSTVAESMAVGPLPLRWKQGIVGELWAEFVGCFILICFGDGVVAMLWALPGSGRGTYTNILNSSGDWLLITWGWALAVVFAIYVVGGVTGAHINPAVTFGAAIRKQLPWNKVPGYWVAQVLGCFVGAALVYLVYVNAIDAYNTANHIVRGTYASKGTYSTFATFPAPYFSSVWGPLIDQIVGTFFLVTVRVGGDRRVQPPGRGEHDPMDRGHDRDGGRDLVRSQRWLRDQPGTRLRSAHIRLDCGLGQTGHAG